MRLLDDCTWSYLVLAPCANRQTYQSTGCFIVRVKHCDYVIYNLPSFVFTHLCHD